MQWYFPLTLGVKVLYLIVSYTMGKSGLLDVYTQSLTATDPRAEGVYIAI